MNERQVIGLLTSFCSNFSIPVLSG